MSLKDKGLIELESVGSCIDTKTGMIYPMYADGTHDEEMGVHIMDTDEEWFKYMTKDDCFMMLEALETDGTIDMGFFPEGKDTKWASDVYHISGELLEAI